MIEAESPLREIPADDDHGLACRSLVPGADRRETHQVWVWIAGPGPPFQTMSARVHSRQEAPYLGADTLVGECLAPEIAPGLRLD